MAGAFAYLIFCSTRNLIRARLRSLRQPRYAVGTLFGLLYFLWIFGSGAGGAIKTFGISRDATELGATLLLFLLVALMWVWPGKKRAALGFTPAEVQHLFSAPISRRQLIWYRIARAQIGVVVSAGLFTLLARPADATGVVIAFIGMCVVFGALGFHGMGVSLSREHLGKSGWVGVTRRWVPLAVVVAIAATLAGTLAANWPRLLELPDAAARIREAGGLLSSGVAGAALWPIRGLVRVPMADGWAAFASGLPLALLLWALNALWVVRSDAAFEEASAEQAERIARFLQRNPHLAARATRRRPAPFVLAPIGRVEMALLWKNLILVGRMSPVMLVSGAVAALTMFVVILVIDDASDLAGKAGAACMMLAFMMLLTGPMQARFDLRQDLAHLPTLKTWPVRGAVLVRGEVLAPIVVLSAVTSVLIAASAGLGGGWLADAFQGSWTTIITWAVASMLVSSGLIAVQVVAQNAIAVLFPAWMRTDPRAAGSVEGMGQQMLLMMASFLLMPIAALPAALLGAIAWFALQWTVGVVPVMVPAAIATAVLLAECWLGIEAIGAALDRTDGQLASPGVS